MGVTASGPAGATGKVLSGNKKATDKNIVLFFALPKDSHTPVGSRAEGAGVLGPVIPSYYPLNTYPCKGGDAVHFPMLLTRGGGVEKAEANLPSERLDGYTGQEATFRGGDR